MERKTKNILLNAGTVMICAIIGATLLSLIYVQNASWGLIEYDKWNPLPVMSLWVLIGVFCGALVIYLLKVTGKMNVIIIGGITGFVSLILYILVTVFASWSYLTAPRGQHYAWGGSMGYAGDILFFIIVYLFVYGIFIVPGFVIGGLIPYFIRRNKSPRLKSESHCNRSCPNCGRTIPEDAGTCPYCEKKFW